MSTHGEVTPPERLARKGVQQPTRTTRLSSRGGGHITLHAMRNFSIVVESSDCERFSVPRKRYEAREFAVEGDYSSASYLVALAAMSGGKLWIENLNSGSLQGDRRVLEIAAEMGAEFRRARDGIVVEGGELSGIEVDLGDTPDLLPTVAILAARARGKSTLYNVEHARHKESDRIKACAGEIPKFGCRVVERKDGLEVYGTKRLKGARVESYGDHRIAMALAVLGLVSEGRTAVEGVESIAISYPEFLNILENLAGEAVKLEG